MIVALDASPLSLLTQRRGIPEADACRAWAESLVTDGALLVVPAVADYEVRRELLRAGKTAGVGRLDALRANPAFRYLPMTDGALTHAANLWADAACQLPIRRNSIATSSWSRSFKRRDCRRTKSS